MPKGKTETPRRQWTPAERARLQQMMAEGFSHAAIAAELGRTTTSVRVRCNKLGIHMSADARREHHREAAHRIKNRPEVRAARSRASAARWAEPGRREAMSKLARDNNWIERAAVGRDSPQGRANRAKANKLRGERQLAWCHPDWRDDYRQLSRLVGTAEARRVILADIEHAVARMTRHELALHKIRGGARIEARPTMVAANDLTFSPVGSCLA